jgi:hypothetical protein
MRRVLLKLRALVMLRGFLAVYAVLRKLAA